MNRYQERASEHFPSVLLGVLGIIQALALEILWESGVGGIGRWRAIDAEPSGWLQISAMFLGIVVVWVMYATTVLRFAWVPRFFDLFFPFVIGLLEFLLAFLCGPDGVVGYFLVLAVIFGVASSSMFGIYRILIGAGDVPEIPLGRQLRSYVPAAVAIVVLLGSSALASATGPTSTVTLVCLALANVGLIVQLLTFRHYWQEDLAR